MGMGGGRAVGLYSYSQKSRFKLSTLLEAEPFAGAGGVSTA